MFEGAACRRVAPQHLERLAPRALDVLEATAGAGRRANPATGRTHRSVSGAPSPGRGVRGAQLDRASRDRGNAGKSNDFVQHGEGVGGEGDRIQDLGASIGSV